MIHDAATVLGHSCERKLGTVLALLRTDAGEIRLRLTPADAQALGSDLRIRAVSPPGERRPAPGAPVQKPGGGIL